MINEDTPSGYIELPTKGFTSSFTDIEDLGCHGFNHLYKAKRNGKLFILKSLSDDLKESVDYQLVLQKEFELASAIDHPNIVKVHYLEDVADIGWCIVMDYIDGVTLSEFLKEKHPAKVYDKIVSELLDAMGYLHSKQIIHADLKPSNVMVTHNGNFVKLIDFGLSDADHYAELKNHACTEGYASPEQKNGGKLDCRSDIYSFGKILQAGFPKKYQSIARKCTRLNPDRRFQNTTEIQEAIRRKKAFSLSANVLLIAAFVFVILFVFNDLRIEKETNNDIVSNNQEIVDTKEIKHFEVAEKPTIIENEEPNPVKVVAKQTVVEKPTIVKNEESNPVKVVEKQTVVEKPTIINNEEPNPVKVVVKPTVIQKPPTEPNQPSRFSVENINKEGPRFDILESEGKYCLVYCGGDTLVPCSFGYDTIIQDIYNSSHNVIYCLSIVRKNGKYGCLRTNAWISNNSLTNIRHEMLLSCEYDEIVKDDFMKFRIGEKWGVSDKMGFCTKCEYDEKPITYSHRAILVYKGKTGVIDLMDGSVEVPFEYEIISETDGFAKVKKNGKYGFVPIPDNKMEPKGSEASWETFVVYLKCASYVYDYAENFHNGKVLVEKNGERFYITELDMHSKWSN